VTHAGGPFNLPTDIAVAPDGCIFMTDGYGNARVHKFSAEGKHLFSWGEPGTEPGQFHLPHGIWIDRRGRVLVADRENDRVQLFGQSPKLLTIWPTELIGPAFFYVDDEDVVYIPEHNSGMVSIVTLDGERLARWGAPIHKSVHGIWCDSRKYSYVVQPEDWGATGVWFSTRGVSRAGFPSRRRRVILRYNSRRPMPNAHHKSAKGGRVGHVDPAARRS
jgi:DNA-binding beta-propeller fold protein YncE